MADDNKDQKITDLLKKVISTGVGAAFLTEEVIKSKLGELGASKEIVQNLLQNAKSTKDEVISSIKSEVRSWIGGIDIPKEVDRILQNYDIGVEATLKFKKKKKGQTEKEHLEKK